MFFVRIVMVLLGLAQVVFMGWAKYITSEVIQNKTETAATKSDIRGIRDDLNYIRTRIDSIFEIRRR